MPTQTTQEYLTKLTVPVLREMLKDFRAVGFSKSKKSELVATVALLMDGAHIDALKEQPIHTETPSTEEVFKAGMRRHAKRLETYVAQNGLARLTPKQLRRANHKLNKLFKKTNWVTA